MNYRAETLFEPEKVKKPSARFQPIYSWIWNSPITEELIVRQIDTMEEWGIYAIYIIPEPPEFRPNSMVTYMTPKYLSEEFFLLVKFAVQYAKEKNMVVWLYDEGGWPSGAACGQVLEKCPECCSKIVAEEEIFVKKGEIYQPSLQSLSVFTENFERIQDKYIAPKDGKIYEYHIKEEAIHLPCLLETKAVDTFVDLTYESYKNALGEDFGKYCPVMFTDEAILHYPYIVSDVVDFKDKTGFDFYEFLPAIFHEKAFENEGELFRIAYMDYTGKMFVKSYMQRISEWCKQNNIMLAGHMDGDHILSDYTRNVGNILDQLRYMDIPGVDVIWNQIEPGNGNNLLFPRLASSAACMTEKYYALTESFAVYGSGLTYDTMRYVINAQAVRGINVINIMSASSGTEGFICHQFRPNFLLESPVTKFLKDFNEYAARISYLSSLGKPCRPVAVYLPLRDLWAQHQDSDKVQDDFYRICNQLEESYVDFDVIDDVFLDGSKIIDGKLCEGLSAYSTVYIPFCKYMPETTFEKLSGFIENGGMVVTEKSSFGLKNAEAFDAKRISKDCLIEVEDNKNQLRVSKRVTTDGDFIYMVFNEGTTVYQGKIEIKNISKPYVFGIDLSNGELYQCAVCNNLKLESGEAKFFLCSDKFFLTKRTERLTPVSVQTMPEFQATVVERFEIKGLKPILFETEEEVGKIKFAHFNRKDFSGGIRYETSFECSEIQQNLLLDIGTIKDCCIIRVNGKEIARKFVSPMLTEVPCEALCKGENHLSVTVYNTPANVYANTDFDDVPTEVKGPYHPRTLVLEKRR